MRRERCITEDTVSDPRRYTTVCSQNDNYKTMHQSLKFETQKFRALELKRCKGKESMRLKIYYRRQMWLQDGYAATYSLLRTTTITKPQ
jgi:hypothetical protein